MSIKTTAVAGQFYPADKEQLEKVIDEYSERLNKDCDYFSRAIIVPHAGYEYSGMLATRGFQYLKKDLQTLFIFAPAHRYAVDKLAVSSYNSFETPLGEVFVHQQFTNEIKEMGAEVIDDAFLKEHSVEVQLPFIKKFMPDANIVPIVVGGANYKMISDIIEKYWDNESVGFVISSDLSHFRNRPEAQRVDNVTADMIENNVFENMLPEQACGYTGICGLLNFARTKGFSMIRVGMLDSSAKTKDFSSVVGYGSWFLAEKDKCEFIAENYPNVIKNLCAISIKSQLDKVNIKIENYPRALETKLASFVTLSVQENLRGCIGSVVGVEPLIVDLCKNARNAAFNDPRFIPVTAKELDTIDLTVSILSTPAAIQFENEEDLLNKIVEGQDGIIIRDVGRQAVYLPEVWNQISDKKEFLNSLKQKAGLKPDWFSKTFEAYKFKTYVIR